MLYIHLPFCHSKCSYCDFYSSPCASSKFEDYITAVINEFDMRANELVACETIYIGGGTPSIVPTGFMKKLFDCLESRVNIFGLKEFTIEVNPEDVSDELLSFYAQHGINRVSMGIQSFDDNILKTINRRHSSEKAIQAVSLLKKHGFNFSCDLIYGLPGQTLAIWNDSLKRLLDLEPKHFSAYLLSYEHGTRLYAMLKSGKIVEADENLIEQMYAELCEQASAAGYDHYEISNFGKPGFHAIHNSGYWNGTPYLGLGASAYSFNGTNRFYNVSDINKYIASLKNGKLACEVEPEDEISRYNDLIVTSLRRSSGVDIEAIPPLFKPHFDKAVTKLTKSGLLAKSHEGSLIIPEEKWLLSDLVMRELIYV